MAEMLWQRIHEIFIYLFIYLFSIYLFISLTIKILQTFLYSKKKTLPYCGGQTK